MSKQAKIGSKETKRKQLIDSIQRVCAFIENYSAEQQFQVATRLERLEKIWESFECVQSELEDVDDSEEWVEDNLRVRSEMEELYVVSKAKLTSILPIEETKAGAINPPAVPAVESSATRVKLPTIALPQFGGGFDEWLTFHDTYLSLIHSSTNISAVEKFHYLRASLGGEAANLIQAITVTSANYELAWNTIVKRYSNKIILRKKHIRSLISLPRIKECNAAALSHLVDAFQRHIQILEQLEEPVKQFSSILIELMADKLDDESLRMWEEAQADKDSNFTEMIVFLEKRVRVLETLSIDRASVSSKKPVKERVAVHAATKNKDIAQVCVMCEKDGHSVTTCCAFKALSLQERVKVVTSKRLCRNCLKVGHMAHACSSKYSCQQCSARHHTLLHLSTASSKNGETSTMAVASSIRSNSNVLLSTVVLLIADAYGKEHLARALLDNGSQPNAMSECLCQMLNLPRKPARVSIVGVDGTTTSAKHAVSAEVKSRVHNFHQTLDFIVLKKVTQNIPSASFSSSSIGVPAEYDLADPEFGTARRVDMIIGAGTFYSLLRDGRVKLPGRNNLLIDTVFGWIIAGDAPPPRSSFPETSFSCHAMTATETVQEQLERFWKIEELQVPCLSPDEQQCEQYFKETTERDEAGRYIVRMPKHADHVRMLGESKAAAQRRFCLLEKRLAKDEHLKQQYDDFMREYVALGHMFPIPIEAESMNPAHYLPHHPVVKEESTTTKVRVVFDGSAKTTTWHSLNDTLLVGPVVQDELLALIVRFRKYQVAVIADIEKMYRQVSMHSDDRRLQRILWRFAESEPIQTFELATVTYGLAPSSFLATRTLLQLAEDEGAQLPLAVDAVKKNLYVDDLISGANSIEEAIQLRNELTELMNKGGFKFRKWCSNELGVLTGLAPELLGTKSSHQFETEESVKTLGIRWEPETDLFRFSVALAETPSPYTKRKVLSVIAQLYDPLGLIGPIIVQAKMLMQNLWVHSLDWDEELPLQLKNKWNEFRRQIPSLSQFRIERFAFTPGYHYTELHCFADASEAAYGACVYIKSQSSDGATQVMLLASKTRVAPLKPLTIPRLELCAALLAARLKTKISAALNMKVNEIHLWSDSTITLQWLAAPPRTWKTFVANRVGEIQANTNGCVWHHVPSNENPADMLSRGIAAELFLDSNLWKHGPDWLKRDKSFWPDKSDSQQPHTNEDLERKSDVILAVQTIEPDPIFKRYSSLWKLVRVTAYCIRFHHNTRYVNQRMVGNLSVGELQRAKFTLAKMLQQEVFSTELQQLQKGNKISGSSPIRRLNPFIDRDGLIRVGGRLQLADVPYYGITLTLSTAREEFWPLNGRRAVRSAIRSCYRCNRADPTPVQQPIGQLPLSRVTPNEVFLCTGVDYCGPILLKPAHRKAAAQKAYICIFVCMSTKAVHLELVCDLSTASFLKALDRFIWRRNKPQHIYSDNGTNFIGAKNALHHIYRMLTKEPDRSTVYNYLAEDGIQWHLIPPRAPNFGGLWEAAVKVAKKHLVKQLGSAMLSYEDMATALTRIEGCMNSRPLTPLSNDPNDLSPLTPAHLLVKGMIRPPPEADVTSIPINRLDQYQRLQRLTQDFWRRWFAEYLHEISQQHKRNPDNHQLAIGEVVIIKDDQLPPARWPLARIVELHPGQDGVVRVVTLKSACGTMKRPVSKICLLECAREV